MKQVSRTPAVLELTDEDLGPCMRDLSIPQRAFVQAYADLGGINAAEAARIAGYGTNDPQLRDTGSRLLRDPKVLAAIREEADKRLRTGAILASSVLVQIAQDPMHRDRYKAAVELLNRAGLVVEGVSRVIVEDHRTVEEIERRISDMAQRLGIDPERLLGRKDAVEDIEYEEVSPGLEEHVQDIRSQTDDWQRDQEDFDAILERSEP